MSSATSAVAPKLQRYFDEYSDFHRNPTNKVYHYLGIPLLTAVIPLLLAHVVLWDSGGWFRLDLGIVLWSVATLFYLYLDWKPALPFSAISLALYFLFRDLPWQYSAVGFVVGWVLQFIGHYKYEKRAPAFMKNFEHLLIGPMWVFARWTGYYR